MKRDKRDKCIWIFPIKVDVIYPFNNFSENCNLFGKSKSKQ